MSKLLSKISMWLVMYIVFALLGGVITVLFFKSPTYPIDQVAFVIATPVMLFLFANFILSYFVKAKTQPKLLLSPSLIMLVVSLFSLIGLLLAIGSLAIYTAIGITWAIPGTVHIILWVTLGFVISFTLAFFIIIADSLVKLIVVGFSRIREIMSEAGNDIASHIFMNTSIRR